MQNPARLQKCVLLVPVLVLALAGCTFGTNSAKSTVSPSPATSTPALAAAPTPALSLSCADLFAAGAVQSHLASPVAVKVDETHFAPLIQDIAVLQAGGTECTWGGTDRTDGGYDTGVVLAILPDAASEFASRALPTGALVRGAVGADSSFQCVSGGSSGDQCTGDALAGGYWIEFSVSDSDGIPGAGSSTTQAIVKPIVAAIAAAGGTVSDWARPARTFDGAAFCSDSGASARISAAVGETLVPGPPFQSSGVRAAAQTREKMANCTWASASDPTSNIIISTLPAGSWATSALLAAPPSWTLIGVPTAFTVPNSDAALHGCGDHCEALVSSHGSLVSFSINSTLDPAQADAIVTRLAPAISAP